MQSNTFPEMLLDMPREAPGDIHSEVIINIPDSESPRPPNSIIEEDKEQVMRKEASDRRNTDFLPEELELDEETINWIVNESDMNQKEKQEDNFQKISSLSQNYSSQEIFEELLEFPSKTDFEKFLGYLISAKKNIRV